MTTPRRLVAAGLLALTALVSPALVATAPAVLAATPLALAPAPAATLAVAPASQLVPVPLDPDSDGPTAQDDGTATFGVQPAGPTEPDSRTSYDYQVAAGSTFVDHLAIVNYSTGPLTLDVYGSDALTTPEGGYDLLPADQTPTDAGAWIRIEQRSVTIPGRSRVIVPFRAEIPANAPAGDHAGGLVASLPTTSTDADGNVVRVDQRVGARMNIRVDGLLDPRLVVEDLEVDYTGTANPVGRGRVTVTYRVRNDGNVRLAARQSLLLDPLVGGRQQVELDVEIPELLPGSVFPVTVTAQAVVPTGLINARVGLDPYPTAGPLDGVRLTGVRQEASFLAVPLVLLAGLLVVGLAVMRFRRMRLRPPGSGPSATVAGGSTPPAPSALSKPPAGVSRTATSLRSAATTLGAAIVMGLAVGLVGTAALAGPAAAQERPIDGPVVANLGVTPATGDQDSVIDLQAPVSCSPTASNLMVVVRGPGFPDGGVNVIGNTPVQSYAGPREGTLVLPVTQRLSEFARQQTQAFDLVGTYELVVICRQRLQSASLGNMTATLVFDEASRYTVGVPRVVVTDPVQPGRVAGGAAPPAPTAVAAAPGSGPAAGSDVDAVPVAPAAPGVSAPEAQTFNDRGGQAGPGSGTTRTALLLAGVLLLVVAGARALNGLRRRYPAGSAEPAP